MSTAISIKNVSKKYVIGKQKDGSLRGTLAGLFAKQASTTEEFWALNDVSFDIQQGDVVGIIGKNGAGKSTLLKILSQITKPTTGSIELNGRVASLLEVGTGFHPELTGRENVYLNGTILGMTRKEVAAKFDEIVAFSGVEKFIDTPVKHYSSGMYVRLAFAVAAHLEPEILIIDEVLAVGDAEFQKKCLGKMGEVAGEGRTVIFVSHDLAAVRQLCKTGILMQGGKVVSKGDTEKVITDYQKSSLVSATFEASRESERIGNENIKIHSFVAQPTEGNLLTISSGVTVRMVFFNSLPNINLDATFELRNINDQVIFHTGKLLSTNHDSLRGIYTVEFQIAKNLLNAGNYFFNIIFGQNQRYPLFVKERIIGFEIMNESLGSNSAVLPGVIRPTFDFKVNYHE